MSPVKHCHTILTGRSQGAAAVYVMKSLPTVLRPEAKQRKKEKKKRIDHLHMQATGEQKETRSVRVEEKCVTDTG